MYFDKINSIIKLNGNLINETPLAIRAGRGEFGGLDNPIVRINGTPYIPASTLKGIFRSEAERYVRTILHNEFVCNILNPNAENGELTRKREAEKSGLPYQPCIICRLFGGPTISSRTRFLNAFPTGEKYRTATMSRVTIHRVTGAQYPGRLFDVEFIEPGCSFDLSMEIENLELDDPEFNVLGYILNKLISEGLYIGGMRSIGYGRVKLLRDNISTKKITLSQGKILGEDITSNLLEKIGVRK